MLSKEFRTGLRRLVGEPDLSPPDDLAALAEQLERKLARGHDEAGDSRSEGQRRHDL